jgi:hypothetical protein
VQGMGTVWRSGLSACLAVWENYVLCLPTSRGSMGISTALCPITVLMLSIHPYLSGCHPFPPRSCFDTLSPTLHSTSSCPRYVPTFPLILIPPVSQAGSTILIPIFLHPGLPYLLAHSCLPSLRFDSRLLLALLECR